MVVLGDAKDVNDVKKDLYARVKVLDLRLHPLRPGAPSVETIRNGFAFQLGGGSVQVMPSDKRDLGNGIIQTLIGKVQKGGMAVLTYNNKRVGDAFQVEPGTDSSFDLPDTILSENENIKASIRIDVFPYPPQFNKDAEVVSAAIIVTDVE